MQISTAFIKSKLKIKKITLLLRFVFIFAVISIFYLGFLLKERERSDNYELNENYWKTYTHTKRKILALDFSQDTENGNCSKPAILEFPPDGFTLEQRVHGWIVLHIVVVFYGFWFLAAICDDYMVPSIDQICSNFKIDSDVIGATIMAASVASPELFMNVVGTFITKGDIGVSTVVGSAVFNVLAVPACCGLFVAHKLKLDIWTITRDCLVYLVAILTLLGILRDGKVLWYEALGLILAYFLYMLVMYYNQQMAKKAKYLLKRCGYTAPPQYKEVTEFSSLLPKNYNDSMFSLANEAYPSLEDGLHSSHMMLYLEHQEKQESLRSPWSRAGRSWIEFILRWPITGFLWLTIPNCRHHSSLKYVTLALAIMWIAIISYVVAFGITIIGDTLHIPDSVMGLTILASGMSIPDAVSSVIVTKQGQASMGLSNTLGSNTFDILLSLGLPWFIKAYFLPDDPQQPWLSLNSDGLLYDGIVLLTSLLGLYLIFVFNKFTLNRKMGLSCLIMYVVLMVFSTLVQLNVFFPVNLPMCPH